MMDGGLCEQSLIRADKLHPSSKLSPEQLALVETLAIGCHASDRGNPQKGENILVIGAGPIGLSTLEFNRLGDANITVMDMSEERLDFCRTKYGIDSLIQFKGDGSEKEKMIEATNGNLFDLVTDATGNQHSMGRCPSICRSYREARLCGHNHGKYLISTSRPAPSRDHPARLT
jgi:alcohol dehydrogenase